jgi:protein-disulfide isomerase
MKQTIAAGLASAIVAGSVLLAPTASRAQDRNEAIESIVKQYLASHPDELGEIVKRYLMQHPEAVGEILVSMLRHRHQANASLNPAASPEALADRATIIGRDAAMLFSSPHQVTLGNPAGDVTLVEFFDYNCGFCKRALPAMLGLLQSDAHLRIVLKEFPILGPESLEAARVAVAVRMQDPTGAAYLAFHRKLLAGRAPANKETALAAAKESGVDLGRIETDMASSEVGATIGESSALARDLALTGTPSYVVGKDVLVGAVGSAALAEKINLARR